jgi:hypothetical protein
MHRNDGHLTEREQLLAIDRELPARAQRLADDHLTRCDLCREQRQQLVRLEAAVARRLHTGSDDADVIRQSRARLIARLSEARHDALPVSARVFGYVQRLAVPAAVVATAAAALLIVRLAGPSHERRSSGTAAAMHDSPLPIAAFTPGATWTDAATELCSAAGRERRDIPPTVRDAVLRNYGMTSVSADDYELDYLITPELGGADDARNLWPQRYASGVWNAHVKDQLEDLLPTLVCEGSIPLQTAQHDIAVNWIAAYKRYFRTSTPLTKSRAAANLRSWRTAPDGAVYPLWRPTDAARLRLVGVTAGR